MIVLQNILLKKYLRVVQNVDFLGTSPVACTYVVCYFHCVTAVKHFIEVVKACDWQFQIQRKQCLIYQGRTSMWNFMKQDGILSAQDIVSFEWHIYLPTLHVAGTYKGTCLYIVLLCWVVGFACEVAFSVTFMSIFCSFCPTCVYMV
jgi:hypothetical protein